MVAGEEVSTDTIRIIVVKAVAPAIILVRSSMEILVISIRGFTMVAIDKAMAMAGTKGTESLFTIEILEVVEGIMEVVQGSIPYKGPRQWGKGRRTLLMMAPMWFRLKVLLLVLLILLWSKRVQLLPN
jgi:hypothetical protein